MLKKIVLICGLSLFALPLTNLFGDSPPNARWERQGRDNRGQQRDNLSQRIDDRGRARDNRKEYIGDSSWSRRGDHANWGHNNWGHGYDNKNYGYWKGTGWYSPKRYVAPPIGDNIDPYEYDYYKYAYPFNY